MEKREIGGRIVGIMLAHEYIEMLYWSEQSYPGEGKSIFSWRWFFGK